MRQGKKDYIQPFKRKLIGFLNKGRKERNFIFYVIYKDTVKKFIIDFESKKFGFIVDTVLQVCITMALDNNCDLEDLIITLQGELIVI